VGDDPKECARLCPEGICEDAINFYSSEQKNGIDGFDAIKLKSENDGLSKASREEKASCG
jgi:hypothetical protein